MFLERLNKYNVNQTRLYEIEKQNKQKKTTKNCLLESAAVARWLCMVGFILGLAAL